MRKAEKNFWSKADSEGGRSAGRKVCTGQAGSKKERRLEESEEDQRQSYDCSWQIRGNEVRV